MCQNYKTFFDLCKCAMTSVNLDKMLEHGHFVKVFEEHPELMQLWKSQFRNMCTFDDKEERLLAFRLRECATAVTDNDDVSVLKKEEKLTVYNYVNEKKGLIAVSPMNLKPNSGREGTNLCIQYAKNTMDLQTLVRVGIVVSEDDGIVKGFDLGNFTITSIGYDNFFWLTPNNEANKNNLIPNSQSDLMGQKLYYNGRCCESAGEGRMMVFFNRLEIPFCYEKRDQMIDLNREFESVKYLCDFLIYPDDSRRVTYIEKKRDFPTIEEQDKMATLVRKKGIPGYIAWGSTFAQPIKWSARKKNTFHFDPDGIRLMKFSPLINKDGMTTKVLRREGYYLACNDKATGREWEEDPNYDASDLKDDDDYPFNVHKLRLYLRSHPTKKIGITKWRRMMLPGRVRRDTRVLVCIDGRKKVFKPKDVPSLMFKCNPKHEDCTSERILDALRYANEYVFEKSVLPSS